MKIKWNGLCRDTLAQSGAIKAYFIVESLRTLYSLSLAMSFHSLLHLSGCMSPCSGYGLTKWIECAKNECKEKPKTKQKVLCSSYEPFINAIYASRQIICMSISTYSANIQNLLRRLYEYGATDMCCMYSIHVYTQILGGRKN